MRNWKIQCGGGFTGWYDLKVSDSLSRYRTCMFRTRREAREYAAEMAKNTGDAYRAVPKSTPAEWSPY